MREVPLLRHLAVLVHDIPDYREVYLVFTTILGQLVRLQDEGVAFAVAVGEDDHHQAVDDLLPLLEIEKLVLLEDGLPEGKVDELL